MKEQQPKTLLPMNYPPGIPSVVQGTSEITEPHGPTHYTIYVPATIPSNQISGRQNSDRPDHTILKVASSQNGGLWVIVLHSSKWRVSLTSICREQPAITSKKLHFAEVSLQKCQLLMFDPDNKPLATLLTHVSM